MQPGLWVIANGRFAAISGAWIRAIFPRRFQPLGFVAVLDTIHAVTCVSAAATAGRAREEGAAAYRE